MNADAQILVAGESLIDLVPSADRALTPLPGGGPFNVARGVARLGVPCAFLGALSSDRFGALLRAALRADGVRLDAVVDTDQPTSLAVAELDVAGSAHYRFYLEGTAAVALTASAALAALRSVEPRALHVGTLGLAAEPLADAVEQVVATVADDVIVMVDPNWRPGTLVDAAPWRSRLERVLARADIVKVSTEDLRHLAPDVPPHEAAQRLLAGRTRCVLVTDGEADALVLTAEGRALVSPPRVDVVDTVGAGDAFCAGVLTWCIANDATRESLGSLPAMTRAARFAALVAARTCERAGADPPRLEQLGEAVSSEVAYGSGVVTVKTQLDAGGEMRRSISTRAQSDARGGWL
jgi:fructokinase